MKRTSKSDVQSWKRMLVMSDGWYGMEGLEDDEDDAPDQQVVPPKRVVNQVPQPKAVTPPVVEEVKELYINKYRHCGAEWEDAWTSASNDCCPMCGSEITPYESEEVGVL